MSHPHPAPRVGELALLGGLSAATKLGGALALGVGGPFGEDAPYWVYRAIELREGALAGDFPPLYPLLSLAAGALPGVELLDGAWGVALVAGGLAPVALAWGVGVVAGRGPGLWAGGLALLLPNLLAWSLRVEASALYLLLLGLLVGVGGHALRRGSAALAALAGLALVALATTKESGLALGPALALAALVSPARLRLLPGLGAGVALGLALASPTWRAAEGEQALAGKTGLPFVEVQALLSDGRLPPPLLDRDDPALLLDDAATHALTAPERTPGERLAAFAALQLRRLWRFVGLWAPTTALALAALGWAARRGAVTAEAAALLGAAALPLALCLVVVVHARHAEAAIWGSLGAVGVVASGAWRRGGAARAAVAALTLALAAQGAWLLGTVEARRAESILPLDRLHVAVAHDLLARIDPALPLCSSDFWLAAVSGRPTLACYQPGYLAAGPLQVVERPPRPEGIAGLDPAVFNGAPALADLPWREVAVVRSEVLEPRALYRVGDGGEVPILLTHLPEPGEAPGVAPVPAPHPLPPHERPKPGRSL